MELLPSKAATAEKIQAGKPYVYRDHAALTSKEHNDLQQLVNQTDAHGVKGTDQTFPVKLHQLLNEESFSHIVSWQPHGRSFIVRRHVEFVEQVLPCCFRQSKFASFQRQLNLYGFRRCTTGVDKGSYYHEYFLRGRPHLALRMQRTKVKGTGARRPSFPDEEPDFYTMPFVYEQGTAAASSPQASPVASADKTTSVSLLLRKHISGTIASPPIGSPTSANKLAPQGGSMPRPSREMVAEMMARTASRFEASQLRASSLNSSMTANRRMRDLATLALFASARSTFPATSSGPLHLNYEGRLCECAIPAF